MIEQQPLQFELAKARPRRAERPMTIGANALAPQPIRESHLWEVPNGTPNLEPADFQAFKDRKKPGTIPLASPDALARQQVLEGDLDSGKFIEREIDPDNPWSAFGQVMFVKEHIIDGKVVKKIAAISIAYPGGVGTRMAGEALGKTLGVEPHEFERWKGVKEGGIIAASKEVPDITEQLGLMGDFIENSGAVIQNRHAQAEHEVVQHFFGLQDARRDFLDTVREDAMAILTNPEFTGTSALDPRYEGTGVYLVEGIVKDGVWEGGDPQGKLTTLTKIAADEPHLKWLKWAEKTASSMKGDGVIVDAEDTETVHDCGGGKKGCSEFFEKMEGATEESNLKTHTTYAEVSGIAGAISASKIEETVSVSGGGGGRYDKETCSTCGQYKSEKNECSCSKKH